MFDELKNFIHGPGCGAISTAASCCYNCAGGRWVLVEPEPLTDEELEYLLVRIDHAALPALLRLVAEVRRLRDLVGRMARACECGGAAEQQTYTLDDATRRR